MSACLCDTTTSLISLRQNSGIHQNDPLTPATSAKRKTKKSFQYIACWWWSIKQTANDHDINGQLEYFMSMHELQINLVDQFSFSRTLLKETISFFVTNTIYFKFKDLFYSSYGHKNQLAWAHYKNVLVKNVNKLYCWIL